MRLVHWARCPALGSEVCPGATDLAFTGQRGLTRSSDTALDPGCSGLPDCGKRKAVGTHFCRQRHICLRRRAPVWQGSFRETARVPLEALRQQVLFLAALLLLPTRCDSGISRLRALD